MLSPGGYWKAVPKDLKKNLGFRQYLLGRCNANKRYRQAVVEMCSKDLLFYVSAFCWTFDPRTERKFLPFVTWPIQDKAFLSILECIEQGRDLVIEKSRDMGASWMSLTVMEWLWHWKPGNSFLMVSRKEDLVDAPGDPDSLFGKVDFIHRHLPNWLRPETDRRKLHFGNLDNGSTIDGESTTAAAGVGGRRTAMFIDEFSRIEEGYQLLAGTADTTRCRIFNFTPFGTSNAAYKLARRGDVRKLRLHWSDHPEKARGLYRWNESEHRVERLDAAYEHGPTFNFVLDGRLRSPWYDGECERRANDREVAQMLDIDYQGSAYQFFDKYMIQDHQRTFAIPPYWEGDCVFDSDAGTYKLEKSAEGPLKLWCHLDVHGKPVQSTYGAGADLSWGTGATSSCLSVVDGKTGEKVAEYTNPYISPERLAPIAVAILCMFKDLSGEGAAFAWEQQGPGIPFGKGVIDTGYRNIHYRTNPQLINAKGDAETPGWNSAPDAKKLLLTEYREALSTRKLVNRSALALEECLFFEHTEGGKVEHKGGDTFYDPETGKADPSGAGVNHGDHVIADALAWMMVKGFARLARKKKEEVPLHPSSLAFRRQYHDNLRRQLEEADA